MTGGAGVLCSMFAKALTLCGAKVAVLDLAGDKAEALAAELRALGGEAIGVAVNVLETESVQAAHQKVLEALGPCDILVNGAGGNNAKATTDDEFFHREESLVEGKKSFFDLDPAGFDFVFGLNLKGTLLPTQAFARDMAEKSAGTIINISSMNAFTPLTKIPAYSAAKAAVSQLYPVARRLLFALRRPRQRDCPGVLFHAAERQAALERRRHAHRADGQDPAQHADGALWRVRRAHWKPAVPAGTITLPAS